MPADPHAAILFVLHLEDESMKGVISNRKDDRGGRTRWGIAERWHPELTHLGFYDTMNTAQSLEWACLIYESAYAKPLNIAALNDQRLANSALSIGVVSGLHSAVLLLQDALATIGEKVPLSGVMDAATILKANSANAQSLLIAYVAGQKARFRRIVASDPGQKDNLAGWLNRADKVLTQAA